MCDQHRSSSLSCSTVTEQPDILLPLTLPDALGSFPQSDPLSEKVPEAILHLPPPVISIQKHPEPALEQQPRKAGTKTGASQRCNCSSVDLNPCTGQGRRAERERSKNKTWEIQQGWVPRTGWVLRTGFLSPTTITPGKPTSEKRPFLCARTHVCPRVSLRGSPARETRDQDISVSARDASIFANKWGKKLFRRIPGLHGAASAVSPSPLVSPAIILNSTQNKALPVGS
ncbi:uncharacterized protein LOC119237696 isoform X2 [Talpa occidentalis]|uniref:uncharacterized protein LOC119237696 isoform X2 n=1 Tax=Talpa occidentalis TaxID=50954 RepID=UPI00188DD3A7|nr:uncharacterized protein LOC119237696 isoform X2 [Talpa occidentalis]